MTRKAAGGSKTSSGTPDEGVGGKKITSLRDLTPDDLNTNRGTQRGLALLEQSVRDYGVAESITTDRDGRIIGGNKRTETMMDCGFADVEPIVVETDGTRPVVLKRTDLSLDDPEARELGLMLNRSAQVSINYDSENLRAIAEIGADLSKAFQPDELDEIHAAALAAQAAAVEDVGRAHLEQFQEHDEETVQTEHTCPKCGHEF